MEPESLDPPAAQDPATAAELAALRRFRAVFHGLDDGYCLMELLFDSAQRPVDYRFLETNSTFEAQTGLRGALGKTARELVPDLDASWFELYGKVALTGEPLRFENHAPAMGRWFDVYAMRVGEPEQRLVALVFRDVSARKQAEHERDALLARESEARQRAEEANRLKDDFVANVSHELRTPLSAIMGWAQVLREGDLPAAMVARGLEAIERNARAQARLVEDLLDVSRVLAGKLSLRVETIELGSVVEAAVEAARPLARKKNVALTTRIAAGVVLSGDPQRLQQVVGNLLANALKFTPAGGSVEVALGPGTSPEISVRDTGVGIPSAFLPHVFERFRQADGAAARSHGGLGLGLSIVRQLVELHGGHVWAESDGEGRGACFTVRLPPERAAAAAPSPRGPEGDDATQPELDGLHVLVAEDDADMRELLGTLLAQAGARVRLTASVPEALAAFESEPPDVLLSDLGMPGEDGYALITRVRNLPRERGGDVPAIAISAFTRPEDRARAGASGFGSQLSKPLEPEHLMRLLLPLAALAREKSHAQSH